MAEYIPSNALLGEIISIGVAFSWTLAALSSEIGSKLAISLAIGAFLRVTLLSAHDMDNSL